MLIRILTVTGLCVVMSGCASFTKEKDKSKTSKSSSWLPWSKKEYQTPTSMAVIWSEDVLTLPGHPVTRGFGGRIYFYNEKSQAIPVEGELVVHGFDESMRQQQGSNKAAADKRFRFTSEQFTEHFSESQLGASYNVWIPWDAGGTPRKITLVPTFITTKGNMVRAEAAKVTLSGVSAGGEEISTPPVIQQISHSEPTVNGPLPRMATTQSSPDTMRTTTIQLPSASTRRPAGSNAPSSVGRQSGELPASVSYGNNHVSVMTSTTPNGNNLTPQQMAMVQALQSQMTNSALQSMQGNGTGVNPMANPAQAVMPAMNNAFPNLNPVVPSGFQQSTMAAPTNMSPPGGMPSTGNQPGVPIPASGSFQPQMQSFPARNQPFSQGFK